MVRIPGAQVDLTVSNAYKIEIEPGQLVIKTFRLAVFALIGPKALELQEL